MAFIFFWLVVGRAALFQSAAVFDLDQLDRRNLITGILGKIFGEVCLGVWDLCARWDRQVRGD